MDVDSEGCPLVDLSNVLLSSVDRIFCSIKYAKKPFNKSTLEAHSVSFPSNATSNVMRSLLSLRITSGNCLGNSTIGCRRAVIGLIPAECVLLDHTNFQILLMSSLVKSLSLRSFCRVFNT